MKQIISDNIDNNEILKQIGELIEEFIQEQVQNNDMVKYSKKVSKHYAKLLSEIVRDNSKNSKIYYVMDNDQIVGLEVGLVEYSKKERIMIGYKPCIYIKKEYRGKRIDGRYIAFILDGLIEDYFRDKKVTITRIVTLDGNERQIKAYKHFGYKVIAVKDGTVYFEKRNS